LISKKIGCIFDMDGVLFLSSEIHHLAFCEALIAEPVEVLDYCELAGMRTDSALRKIFNQSGVDLSSKKLKELVFRKRKYAAEMLQKHPPIAPNCHEVIVELYRRGIFLALASSSSFQNVQLFLDFSKTREFFSVILSGEDVKNAKPNPEIFRTARNYLGLLPQFCFVIEDSESGIRGAQADDMKVIGVVGLHTRRELELFGSIATISRLDELLQLNEFQHET
jgi:HAD superfamily hydrolase (TIGR01509 family)